MPTTNHCHINPRICTPGFGMRSHLLSKKGNSLTTLMTSFRLPQTRKPTHMLPTCSNRFLIVTQDYLSRFSTPKELSWVETDNNVEACADRSREREVQWSFHGTLFARKIQHNCENHFGACRRQHPSCTCAPSLPCANVETTHGLVGIWVCHVLCGHFGNVEWGKNSPGR